MIANLLLCLNNIALAHTDLSVDNSSCTRAVVADLCVRDRHASAVLCTILTRLASIEHNGLTGKRAVVLGQLLAVCVEDVAGNAAARSIRLLEAIVQDNRSQRNLGQK